MGLMYMFVVWSLLGFCVQKEIVLFLVFGFLFLEEQYSLDLFQPPLSYGGERNYNVWSFCSSFVLLLSIHSLDDEGTVNKTENELKIMFFFSSPACLFFQNMLYSNQFGIYIFNFKTFCSKKACLTTSLWFFLFYWLQRKKMSASFGEWSIYVLQLKWRRQGSHLWQLVLPRNYRK